MRVLTRVVLTCLAACSTAAFAAASSADTPKCESQNCIAAASQEISGVITINRRLTKRSVTPSVSVYQRGTTVELGKDAAEDPIAFERSRVIVYLEGPLPAVPAHRGPIRMDQVNHQIVAGARGRVPPDTAR